MGGGITKSKSKCNCININKNSIIKIENKNQTFYTKVNKYPELNTNFCMSKENIFKIYTFIRLIAKGSFSRVKLAYKNNDGESFKYGIKIVNKKGICILVKNSILNELGILATLDHPNIVKIFEVYEDEHNYYIVMEYLGGGTLLRVIDFNIYNDISKFFYKIISAINYCHDIGIVHRDIKPENILFVSNDPDSDLKLIDFGLSKKLMPETRLKKMNSFLGTPNFIAPEIYAEEEYDNKCDMYSIGVTLCTIIIKKHLYFNEEENQFIYTDKNFDLDFSELVWNKVPNNLKDLTKKLIKKIPIKRLNAKMALNHKFFKNLNKDIHDYNLFDEEILLNLIKYKNPKKFIKIIYLISIDYLPKEDLKHLNDVFNAIDRENFGFLTAEDLKFAYEKSGFNLTKKEISGILTNCDCDKNGKINYSEFILAAVNMKEYLNDKILYRIFSKIDTFNKNYIDKKSIINCLIRSGKEIINFEELDNILKEVINDKNKKILFEEFLEIMI